MRLFGVLSVLSLLLGARASSLDSREPTHHRFDVRDTGTSDMCAAVNAFLPFISSSQGITIDGCFCLSDVTNLVDTDPFIPTAQKSYFISNLKGAITQAAAKSKCTYPEQGTPACVYGNLCGFRCTNGFTPSPPRNPTLCVCSAPSVICNGQCVAPGACPSSRPDCKKRSWVGSGICSDMGPGWVACGVLGGGPRAWECVNSARDLESCGGCTFPLTAYSPIGKDCSTLPGVADVACLSGECIVRRCLPGYVVAPEGNSCTRKHSIPQSQFDDADDMPARVYGLGHVPLGRH